MKYNNLSDAIVAVLHGVDMENRLVVERDQAGTVRLDLAEFTGTVVRDGLKDGLKVVCSQPTHVSLRDAGYERAHVVLIGTIVL